MDDSKQTIRELLGCVQIDYAPNTHKAMVDIVGEEPQPNVLAALITNNLTTLKDAADMSQSYRYGILTKLLGAEYRTLKEKLSANAPSEEASNDERVDIADLLEDFFSDDDL